jgi:NAD(P)-dependent dehydrogenase (short-subunit alcohol dehydrogenase family)
MKPALQTSKRAVSSPIKRFPIKRVPAEINWRLDDIEACRTRRIIRTNASNTVTAKEIPVTTNIVTIEPGGRLRGKVAVVTGAARGIGRAVAIAFAREGADIVGIDICASVDARSGVEPANLGDLTETGRLIEVIGRRWLSVVLDQRDGRALRACASEVQRAFGGIDILFANAGIQSFHSLLEMEDADWNITVDVNLTGTANVIRAFAPYLVNRGGGRIIVTSSTQGRHGMKFGAAYSASKWGIIGLMKSAALELGPHGITVNALIPGLIDTPLTRHRERYAQTLEDSGKAPTGTASDEVEARKILATKTPLGVPWIEADDVAPVVVFLASDAARMVSGATYDVTAGDSARNTA